MKIEQRIDSVIMRHDLYRNEFEETKQQCLEIAEDFAVDFAEWLIENKVLSSKIPTKELLDTYKKEKEL